MHHFRRRRRLRDVTTVPASAFPAVVPKYLRWRSARLRHPIKQLFMPGLRAVRDALLVYHDQNIIDDDELLLLYDLNSSKKP